MLQIFDWNLLWNILGTASVVLLLMTVWISVQTWSRRVAKDNPEFGRAKEEGGGCGIACGCASPCLKKIIKDKFNIK